MSRAPWHWNPNLNWWNRSHLRKDCSYAPVRPTSFSDCLLNLHPLARAEDWLQELETARSFRTGTAWNSMLQLQSREVIYLTLVLLCILHAHYRWALHCISIQDHFVISTWSWLAWQSLKCPESEPHLWRRWPGSPHVIERDALNDIDMSF